MLDPVVAGTEQLVSQSSDQVFSPKAPDSPGSAAVTPVNSGPRWVDRGGVGIQGLWGIGGMQIDSG